MARKLALADRYVDEPERTADDDEIQHYLLQRVSRTFALTIPQLPQALARVVANAYLLCRISDTIEDEAQLSADQKHRYCEQLIDVIGGDLAPTHFSGELLPLLSAHTSAAERQLIQHTPNVIRITRSFSQNQRDALKRCLGIMTRGMAQFQQESSLRGLVDVAELGRYCYVVAGVVGEMLTRLFCDYSEDIAKNRDALMRLSVSFGQGLQMTNILKDLWDDHARGACWLPRDVFARSGFDLTELTPGSYRDSFGEGLAKLIALAHSHLRDALAYTLFIPARETGIRNFCLWAIGMALLTLRRINERRNFTRGAEVKISHSAVTATVVSARLAARSDRLLRSLFYFASRGLPAPLTAQEL